MTNPLAHIQVRNTRGTGLRKKPLVPVDQEFKLPPEWVDYSVVCYLAHFKRAGLSWSFLNHIYLL